MMSRMAEQRVSEKSATPAIVCRLMGLPVLVGVLWLAAGCSQEGNWWQGSPRTTQTDQTAQATHSPEETPAADQRPPLAYSYPDTPPVLDAKNLDVFVTSFKHHRRLVLLDFWASWCRHSTKELAEMARLQESLGPDGLQVVACNLDAPDRWATHTVPILNDARANFPCVVIPQEQKRLIKDWLAVDWSYDLPARFLVDPRARQPAEILDHVSLAMSADQIRRCASAADAAMTGMSATASALRFRLIDVRKGSAVSMPEVVTDPADPAGLAEQAVAFLDAEIDRRLNVRIAVSPFMSSRSRTRADAFGRNTARQFVQALRAAGYYDIIGPEQTEEDLRKLSATALAIEFDPETIKDRLACDYLVLGWLRGNVRESPLEPEARVVGDGATAHPAGDPAFEPAGDNVEP
ncbi:MAG: redoxin domain-containing protein [Planctomycetota bacterium]